jgi:hypothetical protein
MEHVELRVRFELDVTSRLARPPRPRAQEREDRAEKRQEDAWADVVPGNSDVENEEDDEDERERRRGRRPPSASSRQRTSSRKAMGSTARFE